MPEKPAFDRETFQHSYKTIAEDISYDDCYSLNTQSGTQWDGFRHVSFDTKHKLRARSLTGFKFSHIPTKLFYNKVILPVPSHAIFQSNTHSQATSKDFFGENPNLRCSIHHWAEHGIAGRGILLDYRHYALTHNKPYDPYTSHAITLDELKACGASQGLDIRPESEGGDIRVGDFLLIRSGFVEKYHQISPEERYTAATRTHDDLAFAGVSREQAVRDWLHDCYFAGVAGDSPTFEVWPVPQMDFLHQSLLALWGCPIGEMWDLEKLAEKCRERGKWTFFMTSAPANMPGKNSPTLVWLCLMLILAIFQVELVRMQTRLLFCRYRARVYMNETEFGNHYTKPI